MIERAIIKNFRSHIKTEFDFHPGFNVIIGATDSGKSQAFNALRWCFDNKPLGDKFRSWYATDDEVFVEIHLTPNHVIKRILKGNEHSYVLDSLNPFTAFKTNIPDEIKAVLNISDINIQRQLDQHFLFSKTSGEVANYFNKIAKLDKITISTQNINSWILDINSSIKHKKKQLEDNIADQKKFDFLEKFEIELEVLEKINSQYLHRKSKVDKLVSLSKKIKESNDEIKKLGSILTLEPVLNNVLDLQAQIKEKTNTLNKLLALKNSIQKYSEQIKELNKKANASVLVDRLEIMFSNIGTTQLLINKLTKLKSTLNLAQKDLIEAKVNFAKAHSRFEQLKPDICPFCEQKINKK